MESDKGVRAHLLDRQFGDAGRGVSLTRAAEVAERRAKLNEQRAAVASLDAMKATRPLKPPAFDYDRHTPKPAASHLSVPERAGRDARMLERDLAALTRMQAARPLRPPGAKR